MKSERNGGYILPLSLFILLILSMVTVQGAVKYETEKRFFAETKTGYELEILLFSSLERVKTLLKEGQLAKRGTFNYDFGSVTYELTEESETEGTIEILCRTVDGGRHFVRLTYNQSTGEIVRWSEL